MLVLSEHKEGTAVTIESLMAYLHQFRPEEAPGSVGTPQPEAQRSGAMTIEPLRRGTAQPSHAQPYYELLYVLAGSVVCVVAGNELTVPAGAALLLAAGVQRTLHVNSVGDIAVSVMLDEPRLPVRFFEAVGQLPAVGEVFRLNLFRRWLLLDFGVGSRADTYGRLMLCDYFEPGGTGLTAELLLQLFLTEADSAPVISRSDEGIEGVLPQIAQYIRIHCAEATLEDTAQRFGYSPDYLSGAIHRQYGVSFTGYRNQHCLLRAAALLCDTNRPVAEIAAMSGIPSGSHFRRLFAAQFHMTPAQYRKTYGGNQNG